MQNKVQGLVVDKENKVKYFIVKFTYNTLLYNLAEMKKQLDYFKIDGVVMKKGVLTLTEKIPKYRMEGLEKVEEVVNTLERNKELKKRLAGIDEYSASITLSRIDGSIYVSKSFRDDEFFTDYDYEESGYNDAQFIGEDIIPGIVLSYLDGIKPEQVDCSGGEKLWFSVTVDCNEFAKLTPIN